VLPGAQALRNADSFVVTMLTLARSAGGAPAALTTVGAAPADTMSLVTPTGLMPDRNDTARRALGFLQSWLNYAAFWTPDLYDWIAESLSAWTPNTGTARGLLEIYAPLFRLHRAGPAGLDPAWAATAAAFQTEVAGRSFPTPALSSHATEDDRTRVAGVYDRLRRMYQVIKLPLTVAPAATGDGRWAPASGLPGLSASVELHDGFFALTPAEQSRHLVRLMARSMTDVPSALVEAYVEAADGVHRLRGLGP
jgi:hypothetical protein